MRIVCQEFWAQVYNVPFLDMSIRTVIQINEKIGTIVNVDLGPTSLCLGW